MKKMMSGPLPRFRYLCSDYVGPFRPWMFRPYCWLKRRHEPHHCDAYFEMCVWCCKPLWSNSKHGRPNPLRGAKFASLTGSPHKPKRGDR